MGPSRTPTLEDLRATDVAEGGHIGPPPTPSTSRSRSTTTISAAWWRVPWSSGAAS